MDNGYFKVHRRLFNNPIWAIKPYSKGQALIELIGTANHSTKIAVLGNEEKEIFRGQLQTSESTLAGRWGWSRKKVRTYLEQLERLEMITTKSTTKGTTITIENYEIYQGEGTTEDTTEEHRRNIKRTSGEHQKNIGGTTQEHQKNIAGTSKELSSNYIKNVKNDKNIYGDFFEEVWTLYPVKKGKGSVSDTQKKKLYDIGLEEMTRAIAQYKQEQEGIEKKFWKHGSTFFNSGYVDYLDVNYEDKTSEEETDTDYQKGYFEGRKEL